MSLLDTNYPLTLLHRDIPSMPDIPHYDIMLSPQFYIIRHETLPIKYSFQAKKLAPSILDDLSGDDEMIYEVFADGDKWSFVGYDIQKIADFLETKGGSIDKVGHIYFAEQVRDRFTSPVELNEREALSVVNGTVTLVPRQFLPSEDRLVSFDGSFRPDRSFRLQKGHNNLINNGQALVIAGIIVILGIAYFAEGFRYYRAASTSDKKLEKLLSENPSLRSTYKRNSLHEKYIGINTEQRAIRDRIKAISRMTSNKTKINSIEIDKKGYKLTLSIPSDSKTIKSLRTIAQNGDFANLSIKGNKLESKGGFQ